MADATSDLASAESVVTAVLVLPTSASGDLASGASGFSGGVEGGKVTIARLESAPSGVTAGFSVTHRATGALQSRPSEIEWDGGEITRYRGSMVGSHVGLRESLNRNFQKISHALVGAVGREESRPMKGDLDMNSHHVRGVRSLLDPGCPWAGPLDMEELDNLVTLAGLEDPNSLLFCITRASVQEQVQSPYYAPGWCETYNLTSKLYPLYPIDGVQSSAAMRDGIIWAVEPEEVASSAMMLDGVLRDPIISYDHTSEPEEVTSSAIMLDGILRNPVVPYDHTSEPEEVTTEAEMLDGTIRVALISYDHTTDPEEVTTSATMLDGTLT